MVGLRAVIIIVVLMALVFNVVGRKDHHLHSRHAHHHDHPKPCSNDPQINSFDPPCSSTSTQSSSTTEDHSEEEATVTASTSSSDTTTTSQPTSLERAHWCRFNNGTYLPLGTSFMNNPCTMCQCARSRAILCQTLECLPTYCVDNTMPHRKDGQCCAQCGYEVARNSCVYNGVSYPHGVVMKTVESEMQCWCQLGNIECRNYIGSLFGSLSMMADDKAILIIAVVLSVVLLFGLLICCSCTLFIYLYYRRYQHTFQQAYNQYISSAGWQPMNEEEEEEEEENVVGDGAEEKYLEAEKYQSSEATNGFAPPPYALNNDAYVSDEQQKQI